jgi:hypothetical protein
LSDDDRLYQRSRYGDQFIKLRHRMYPDGKFPASALIAVSNFAQPEFLLRFWACSRERIAGTLKITVGISV